MQKYTTLFMSILLALLMGIFGLNKFLGFIQVPPPAGQAAQVFLGAMFTSYLAWVVGATEVIGGLLLCFRRTSFLGVLLLAPVIFNIAAFHIAHDMPGNGIWLLPLGLYVGLVISHKSDFQALVKYTKI